MKKALLTLAAAVTLCMSASAQRAELFASYGGYTQMDACNNHDSWGGVHTAWGAVNAGLNFKVRNNLWIGPSYTFSSTTAGGGPNHSKITYNAVLLNGRYEYLRSGAWKIYAHLGLGVEISHMMPRGGDPYNCAYFAIQASPFGVSTSLGKNFSFFGEVGFGVQGLVQAGFRLNL